MKLLIQSVDVGTDFGTRGLGSSYLCRADGLVGWIVSTATGQTDIDAARQLTVEISCSGLVGFGGSVTLTLVFTLNDDCSIDRKAGIFQLALCQRYTVVKNRLPFGHPRPTHGEWNDNKRSANVDASQKRRTSPRSAEQRVTRDIAVSMMEIDDLGICDCQPLSLVCCARLAYG